MGYAELAPGRVVAYDDRVAQVSVTSNTTGNVILSFRTPPGLIGRITSFGQAWDAAYDTYASFYLRVNGMILWPVQGPGATNASFTGSRVQIAAPEQCGLQELPKPIPVEQMSLIEAMADVASGPASSPNNITARLIVKYFDPLEVAR